MKETLFQEVANEALARIRARDVPASFWKDAAKEAREETPTDPAMHRWIVAQILRSLEATGTVDARELTDLALSDELLERRTRGAWEEAWRKIKDRIISKLIDEGLARRIADGSVIEVAMEGGEIGYQRKKDA